MANIRTRMIPVDGSTSGTNELVAAITGSFIRVVQIALVAAEAVTVKLKSGSTDITGAMAFGPNVPFIDRARAGHGLCATAKSQALNMSLGAAKQVGGYIVVEIIPETPTYT